MMLAALNAWSPIEHRDAVSRDGDERLERRYRGARSRRLGLRALDVERRREAGALAGRDEAQRFVLRGRYRAHRLELAQRADEREVVGRDVGQHQQAHAARAVLDRERVGRGRRCARAQATGEVDFPRRRRCRRSQCSRSGTACLMDGVVVWSV